MGGIPYEDHRVSYEDLYKSGMVIFGTYPALEVNGQPINQTHAMAAFAGKISGFYPSDLWLAAKVDEIFAALTDATFCITKTQGIRDVQAKTRARVDMMKPGGRLYALLSGINNMLFQNGKHGLCAGNALTVADFALWRAVIWWCSGIVVGLDPSDVEQLCPEFVRLYNRIEALPLIKDWKERYPEFYASPEARWKTWRPYPPASFLTNRVSR